MPNPLIDITGQKFCRLTVIKQAGRYERSGAIRWECLCDCGKTTYAHSYPIRSGKIKSCGCWGIDAVTTHGMTHSPTYTVWVNMRFRCQNPRHTKYKHYGARGIKVCERWSSFENFLADMGERPKGMFLDRIDNDGDYSPENCRWVIAEVQMNNRRNTRLLTFMGKTMSVAQWSREVGLSASLIWSRIVESNWPVEKALTEPVRYSKRSS